MSKRDSSSTTHTSSLERPSTKKSKTNPSEDVPMDCDEATEIVPVAGSSGIVSGPSGVYPKASRELSGKHPAPANRNQRSFRENPGPSKMNPRASNSPRPSFLCPDPNAWPSAHRTELSYVNPTTSRSHRPKTHRSRADSKRDSISPLIADVSQLNLNDPPEGTEKSREVKLKRAESSSSTEREQESKCLDWTGSRM